MMYWEPSTRSPTTIAKLPIRVPKASGVSRHIETRRPFAELFVEPPNEVAYGFSVFALSPDAPLDKRRGGADA